MSVTSWEKIGNNTPTVFVAVLSQTRERGICQGNIIMGMNPSIRGLRALLHEQSGNRGEGKEYRSAACSQAGWECSMPWREILLDESWVMTFLSGQETQHLSDSACISDKAAQVKTLWDFFFPLAKGPCGILVPPCGVSNISISSFTLPPENKTKRKAKKKKHQVFTTQF